MSYPRRLPASLRQCLCSLAAVSLACLSSSAHGEHAVRAHPALPPHMLLHVHIDGSAQLEQTALIRALGGELQHSQELKRVLQGAEVAQLQDTWRLLADRMEMSPAAPCAPPHIRGRRCRSHHRQSTAMAAGVLSDSRTASGSPRQYGHRDRRLRCSPSGCPSERYRVCHWLRGHRSGRRLAARRQSR